MLEETVQYRLENRVSALWGVHEGKDERMGAIAELRPLWTGMYVGLTKCGSPVQYNRAEFLEPSRLLGYDFALAIYSIPKNVSALGIVPDVVFSIETRCAVCLSFLYVCIILYF